MGKNVRGKFWYFFVLFFVPFPEELSFFSSSTFGTFSPPWKEANSAVEHGHKSIKRYLNDEKDNEKEKGKEKEKEKENKNEKDGK
jgi:hypothetical protein